MRDFPIFTTDYGVSSLVLQEIPYKKEAYICIRDVQPGFFEEHLQECTSFCKMAGAERIYASGHDRLQLYPVYTRILEMRTVAQPDPEKMACLFPVTERTVSQWREIYNRKMAGVPNARTLQKRDEKELLESAGSYFVHADGKLLGIGWLKEDQLLAVASVVPGAGVQVMHTLLSLAEGEQVSLEVAAENRRAIRLYEAVGFLKTREIAVWYDVTNGTPKDAQI